MWESQKKMWNSAHLYIMCSEGGGFKCSKRTLIIKAIKAETSATDRNRYKVQFDVDTVNEAFSTTLMGWLGELNIGKLPSIFAGMICFFLYLLTFCL